MLSVDDQGPFPPCPEALNLARHVLWSGSGEDSKIALAVLGPSGARRISFGELRTGVLSVAGALRDRGLSPGDRLLLRIGNQPEFPITFLGAIAAGLVPVPTSAALTGPEISRIAAILKPAAIAAGPDVPLPDTDAPILAVTALTTHSAPLSEPVPTHSNSPAYIVFTSGTSGHPVGVVHAHRAIWARRAMIKGWYGLSATDRLIHAGAMNWTYTLGTGLLDPWTVGATALVLTQGTDLAQLPLLAGRHDATIIAGAPGVFRRLLKAPLPKMRKLRHGLCAGERLSPDLRAAWTRVTGTDLIEAFGQSECSTFISGSPSRPAPNGTTGFAQPGRRVAILGDRGPVPRGEPGEIAIDAGDPGVRLGDLTGAIAAPEDGWFRTGDLGSMAADGSITHLGRLDDILTAGGFRISPSEVEEAMLRHPDILDAAAVETRLKTGATLIHLHYTSARPIADPELSAHAEAHLARYKHPRLFSHHSSLPRGPGGKLLRARLRAATDGGL